MSVGLVGSCRFGLAAFELGLPLLIGTAALTLLALANFAVAAFVLAIGANRLRMILAQFQGSSGS